MRFINKTGNTHNLSDINKVIPFLEDKEQEIDSDSIKRSKHFQRLCITTQFEITYVENDTMEQNLWKMQHGLVSMDTDEWRIKAHFRAHFGGHSGYAKANRNFLFGLTRAGVDVSISPLSSIGEIGNQKTLLERFNRIPNEKSILIHSVIPTFAEKSDFRYRILYTTVEAKTIPKQFVKACELYDEVWTVSDFCKNVFQDHGVKKNIYVIPNAVDTRVYKDTVTPLKIRPSLRSFVFINVATWNYRKGYDLLLKAYLREFTGLEPVSLLLVNHYQYDNSGHRLYKVDKDIKDAIKKHSGLSPAHIARCGNAVEEIDMPRLYRACKCFVLPSRGEGFGLPFVEASLCGLPVIGTNYSGQKMFLKPHNSNLLDVDCLSKTTSNATNVHFWDGEVFPELKSEATVESLGHLMRCVYENYSDAQLKNDYLKKELLQKYTCDAVGMLAKNRLDEIWNTL